MDEIDKALRRESARQSSLTDIEPRTHLEAAMREHKMSDPNSAASMEAILDIECARMMDADAAKTGRGIYGVEDEPVPEQRDEGDDIAPEPGEGMDSYLDRVAAAVNANVPPSQPSETA